jgi:hypothetical protein
MLASVNISNLISILTKEGREAFPYEKHIALMTFATWLFYPNDQQVLQHARTVAAAACYIDSGGKRNPLATLESVSLALLASPLDKPFVAISESSVTQSDALREIVSFFLCCPPEKRPSLNKALFFVNQGGFDYPDMKDDMDEARSIATLKIAWKERAHTGPFLWSSAFNEMGELYDMLPDDGKAFKRAEKMLRKPEKILGFFGMSKFIQERLLSTVDPASRRRFNIKFPKRLLSEECDFTPFDDRQLEILARYRAPTPSY